MKVIKGASRYLDAIVKRKKNIPGVGQYKNFEKAFDISSRTIKRGRF